MPRPSPAAATPLRTLRVAVVAALAGCWGQTPTTQEPSCTVTAVSIQPAQLTLAVGGPTATLTATVAFTNCGTAPPILWTSSSTTAISITGTGGTITLTALNASTAPITVTATASGQSGTAQVTIVSDPIIAVSATTVGFATTIGGALPGPRTITVSNGGGGTLSGLALGAASYGVGATGWLQATLSGVTVTLQAQLGAMAPGSYSATLPITATGATNSPRLVTVTAVVHSQPGGVATIVFERWTGSAYPSSTGEIWRMDPDGQNQVRLTNNNSFDGYPAQSPDRTKIAFSTNRNGNLDLFMMDGSGNGQVGLRLSPNPEVASAWSPDGLRLAYEFIFSASDVDLYLYTLASEVQTALVATPQREENPSWSPPGLEVAFAKDPLGNGAYEIFRVALSGGAPVQLTADPSDDFSPAWSPDGTKIVFSSNRSGTYQLYLMDATTGGILLQLTTIGTNFQASWSPDGTRIAYTSGQGGDWDIWVMNSNGSNKVNLTATPATNEIGASWR